MDKDGYDTDHAEIGDVLLLEEGKAVVEDAEMQGGGCGHGPGDVYPDGWYVSCRLLFKNGKYNPKGKLISFYQSGCFCDMRENVKVIGKMKRTVNFE